MKTPIVADLMTRRVVAVGADTACSSAVRVMLDHHITGAPVIDADGFPVGVISLTDLVDPRRSTCEAFGFDVYYEVDNGEVAGRGSGLSVPGGRVWELMTKAVLAVSALAVLPEAARLMLEHRVHRLVVIDGERLLGILTSLDLTRGLLLGAGATADGFTGRETDSDEPVVSAG